ncbi:MAG: hypothetical protein IAC51_06985 [bacterium]|uniref:Uncharacterized protein n=1 Tax=Candidatus Aphodosoma intestinipullorum TaxID=2840674 RepID=A0A940DKT1_9BACT|nr:hypothetical protein [Candidatus Aphodosoma intestinipullorum]
MTYLYITFRTNAGLHGTTGQARHTYNLHCLYDGGQECGGIPAKTYCRTGGNRYVTRR